jgi:hemerythrin-like domain-containing protein
MTKLWADKPFSLITETGALNRDKSLLNHPAVAMARQMALSHNVILRSMNAAVNQCLSVQPGTTDAEDFLQFNQSMYEILKQHHTVEEEYLFQAIEELSGIPGIMDQNLQEHKDFHDGLDKFRDYVFSTSAANYDGPALKALLEGFGGAVEKHLHNEIPSLLDLQRYDASKLQAIAKELGRRFAASSDKHK